MAGDVVFWCMLTAALFGIAVALLLQHSSETNDSEPVYVCLSYQYQVYVFRFSMTNVF